MEEIIVTQSYLDYIKEKTDANFLSALNEVFVRFDKHIEIFNDAMLFMKNSSNIELNNNIFDLLEQFPEQKPFIYDLLYVSRYSKIELSKELIKEILNIGNKEIISDKEINDAWFFCGILRKLKKEKFFDEYVKILNNKKLGTSRQPIVELLICFENKNVEDILIAHITDNNINGHILDALIKIKSSNLSNIAGRFSDDDRAWVRKLAQKALNENSKQWQS